MRLWSDLLAEERIKIYKQALRMYSRKQNAYSIWRRITASNSVILDRNTVYLWTIGKQNPSRKYLGRVITGPSPELAYLVMATKGDGCAGKRFNGRKGFLYVIEFRVRDKDFADHFASCASAALQRLVPYRARLTNDGFYYVLIRSKMLYELIEQISSSSSWRRRYLETSVDNIVNGVKGFFDAEGGPSVSINNRNEFTAVISAANSDLDWLRYVKKLLNGLGIHSRLSINAHPAHTSLIDGRRVFFKRPTHRLIIARIGDVTRFIKTIGSSIHRKEQKMRDILTCFQAAGRDRSSVWLSSYSKDEKGEYQKKAI